MLLSPGCEIRALPNLNPWVKGIPRLWHSADLIAYDRFSVMQLTFSPSASFIESLTAGSWGSGSILPDLASDVQQNVEDQAAITSESFWKFEDFLLEIRH